MKELKKSDILGVTVTANDKKETYAMIEGMLKSQVGAYIFTPNAEMIYAARRDANFKAILNSAHLLLPDGAGVLIASRLLRRPIPERLTGIDTAKRVLEIASREGLSVFLLGGRMGVAEKAAEALCRELPDLHICGAYHGYFCKDTDSDENLAVIKKIRDTEADILLVCFGSPCQEKWIYENAPHIPSLRLSMGLGGCLDVWSGAVERAPRLIQKSGLEWLYRAVAEPKRLKRFPRLIGFLTETVKTAIR